MGGRIGRRPACALVAFVAVAVAGCVAQPEPVPPSVVPILAPSPTIQPAPSLPAVPTPRPTPTPIPVVWSAPSDAPGGTDPPPPDLARSASAEADGVRITITLVAAPLRAGHQAFVDTTVKNIGKDKLYFADSCSLVGVSGSMDQRTWRPSFTWAGDQAKWKDWAVSERDLETGRIDIGFVPVDIAAQGFGPLEYGCGDTFRRGELAPGRSRTERQVWSGWTTLSHAPPPTGAATLDGVFSFYWREAEGKVDPPGVWRRQIHVSLPVWIRGLPDQPLVEPAEAVDIALADPVFGDWLLSRPLRSGADWFFRYDPLDRTWEVGLTSFNPESRTHTVLIDAFSGEVLGYQGPTT